MHSQFWVTPSHPLARSTTAAALLNAGPALAALPRIGHTLPSSDVRLYALQPGKRRSGETFSRPRPRGIHIMRGHLLTSPITPLPLMSLENRAFKSLAALSAPNSSLKLKPEFTAAAENREMSASQRKKPSKAVQLALDAGAPSIDPSTLPDVTDISPETVTASVISINSGCKNDREKFLIEHLVRHLHDYARETNLTTEEWMTAIQFLTATGQKCSPIRQEFILLSDVLGLSALVDSINNARPPNATENTVLGPFFTEDAADIGHHGSIASEGKGEPLFIALRVLDTHGKPIAGAKVETWETDEEGFYDVQYEGREFPDCRGRLVSREDGAVEFWGVVPVAYPIPSDGPVGSLLRSLHRHVFRPAHLHIMIEADGFQTLTTALYPEGDEYIRSDAVFGVKKSLICQIETVSDKAEAEKTQAKTVPFKQLKWDFVLASKEEADKVREEKNLKMRVK
ncbi:aromatic compound dioxygenase [Calocera viscosa TUFC12733]|uniref:Aromatic compound dioxygenase n=1 Tax=Calocera viscosa (strain TUFC12733) TaxID=1330018 RepID=A0A167NE93_CALVF|nr:aromatic compound dioxygenase [Calocera viscosa TUFC12733]